MQTLKKSASATVSPAKKTAIEATQGAVCLSSSSNQIIASPRLLRHISASGFKPAQTAGRKGEVKILQRCCSSSWIQGVLAGLPSGIPGMGVEIEGAVQQAPHKERHSIWDPPGLKTRQ